MTKKAKIQTSEESGTDSDNEASDISDMDSAETDDNNKKKGARTSKKWENPKRIRKNLSKKRCGCSSEEKRCVRHTRALSSRESMANKQGGRLKPMTIRCARKQEEGQKHKDRFYSSRFFVRFILPEK